MTKTVLTETRFDAKWRDEVDKRIAAKAGRVITSGGGPSDSGAPDLTGIFNRLLAVEADVAAIKRDGLGLIYEPDPNATLPSATTFDHNWWITAPDPTSVKADGDPIRRITYTTTGGGGGGGTPNLWFGWDPSTDTLSRDYTDADSDHVTQDMTGPAPGYTLTPVSGDLHVAAGQLVNGADVSGQIVYDGAGARVQNFRAEALVRGTLATSDRTCYAQAGTVYRINPGNTTGIDTGISVFLAVIKRIEVFGHLDGIHASQQYQSTRAIWRDLFLHSNSAVSDPKQGGYVAVAPTNPAATGNSHCDCIQIDGGNSTTPCGNVLIDRVTIGAWAFDATPSGIGATPQQMILQANGRYLGPNYGKTTRGTSVRNDGAQNSGFQMGGNNPPVYPRDITISNCYIDGDATYYLNVEATATGLMQFINNKIAVNPPHYQTGRLVISRNGYTGLVSSGNMDLAGNLMASQP